MPDDGNRPSDPLGPAGAGGEPDAGSGVEAPESWTIEVGSPPGGAGAAIDGAPGRPDFNEIVAKHGRRLFVLAYRLTGRREDAEDLSQETMVKGYMAAGRFEGRSDFYTYLYRTLVNLWKNQLRRRRRWRMVHLFGGGADADGAEAGQGRPADPGARLADSGPGPHEAYVHHEQAAKLHRALARLEPDFRAVLVLRVAEGLEYEEIAETLGIPVGTVRSRLARARNRIRDLMRR